MGCAGMCFGAVVLGGITRYVDLHTSYVFINVGVIVKKMNANIRHRVQYIRMPVFLLYSVQVDRIRCFNDPMAYY